MKNIVDKKEIERLNDLRNYLMLDTPEDLELDKITKIASKVCKTPIALISLVDEKRQWFKSKVGLDVSETHRDISFCTHAICHSNIFIVEDASKDSRFKDNTLVLNDPHIRFYAGYPLKSKNGFNIGTLCVIDKKKNSLNQDQIDILENLSKHVIDYFEIHKMNIELKKTQESLITLEKMNSIRHIASAMSHEINNPIAIIDSTIKFIKDKYDDNLELKNAFEKTLRASDRIVKVIKSLREFSRYNENEIETHVNLIDIFKNIFSILGKKFEDSKIKIIYENVDCIDLKCKYLIICHAFLNLIMNSFESIINMDEKWIKIESYLDEDNMVIITLTDSGFGISKDISSRMMEPFFSTKEICNTPKGLGLSASKGIIESQGGDLVYNMNSINTSFIIKLPRNL